MNVKVEGTLDIHGRLVQHGLAGSGLASDGTIEDACAEHVVKHVEAEIFGCKLRLERAKLHVFSLSELQGAR